ncbi:hypothetical protein CHUAL_008754 [Chamberlinius hualienensis]
MTSEEEILLESTDTEIEDALDVPGSFECVLCNEILPTKSALQDHFREHATKPPASKVAVKSNENISNFCPPSSCELCGAECSNVRSYWRHYHKFHPDWRGVDCAFCGKHFLQKSDYERHIEEHKDEPTGKEIDCDQCSSKFYSEQALASHTLIHSQVHLLESTVQQESFKAGSTVTSAKLKTTETFRLKASYCKLCRWQFCDSTALAQHLVSHSLYLCLICGKEMNEDETFRIHQKVHLPTGTISTANFKRKGSSKGRNVKAKTTNVEVEIVENAESLEI